MMLQSGKLVWQSDEQHSSISSYARALRIENTLYVNHVLLVGLPFLGLLSIGLPKSVRQKLFNCAQ